MPNPPPAPARFSTTMVALSSRASASATGRATVSATPPGGKGTIMVMLRPSGQALWADAGFAPRLAARAVAAAAAIM